MAMPAGIVQSSRSNCVDRRISCCLSLVNLRRVYCHLMRVDIPDKPGRIATGSFNQSRQMAFLTGNLQPLVHDVIYVLTFLIMALYTLRARSW